MQGSAEKGGDTNKVTNAVVALPEEARQNPIVFLSQLSTSVGELRDVETIRKRLALVAAAEAWAKQYGKQSEPILRHTLATRLIHERRLGELLDRVSPGRPPIIVPPENNLLPDGINRKTSMYAKTLARTPKGWFDSLVKAVVEGTRRYALKEIYLEAQRMAIQLIGSDTKQRGDPALGEEGVDGTTPTQESTDNTSRASGDEDNGDTEVISIDVKHNHIIEGDFRLVASDFPRESVSLIFTDPPYSRESLPLYGSLAQFASNVLLPGGSLLAYAPHYALPQVMKAMSGALRYFWTVAVLHGGTKALMREYGIRVWYKPLVWYVKGDRYNKQNVIPDVIQSNLEKTEHEWEQSIIEAKWAVENLTELGDLVVDPLAGSGTTLIAAQLCNRRWIGIDKDSKTVALANQRLSKVIVEA